MKQQAIEIIPAIDLIGGESVRLSQGDYNRKTVYGKDPVEIAKRFEDAGIRRLHLVDLDGAKAGELRNLNVLERIAQATSLTIDFGGGVSSEQAVKAVLLAGASMVAIGSIAVKAPLQFNHWIEIFGPEKFFLGADVREGMIAVTGWTETTNFTLESFLEQNIRQGIKHVFCTDISRDGMLEGPSIQLYKKIRQLFPELQLVASGGVSKIDDLRALKETGCTGVIIGKAIYENRISLNDLTTFMNK